jgi:hypothetical protein
MSQVFIGESLIIIIGTAVVAFCQTTFSGRYAFIKLVKYGVHKPTMHRTSELNRPRAIRPIGI